MNVTAIGITSQFVIVSARDTVSGVGSTSRARRQCSSRASDTSVIAAGIATDSHHGVLRRCVTARLQVLEMRIRYITGSWPANTRNCAASRSGFRAGAAMLASLTIRA
ncbi:hypothetical protein CSX04_07649 [Burkholderia cepacia]|nr:hypothetical protein CSX04_07649 [Burkholderia cepacia]